MAERRIRVALAHDYLTQRGGAERVVLAMTRAFPDAPLHTLLYEPDSTFAEFGDVDVRPSLLNLVGPLRRNHRAALPLLPFAARSTQIDADVVVASSSGWAHGVRTGGKMIVYCHSPARWLYQAERYLGDNPSRLKAQALSRLRPLLTIWDRRAAAGADHYLANSSVVQERIREAYGRHSDLVHAPVTLDKSANVRLADAELQRRLMRAPFYLVVSRLLPYKNVDAIIRAFTPPNDRHLVVVGSGPELGRLKELAGANVTFLSDVTDNDLQWLYAHARALIAASHEDYGLTPLEAALHGRPSILLRWGGFLDTMVDGLTAHYFESPEPELIARAVAEFEAREWDQSAINRNLERFTEDAFARRLREAVLSVLAAVN